MALARSTAAKNVFPVVVRDHNLADISPVYGKYCQDFDQGSLERRESYVAAMAVPAGDLLQELGEVVDVARHIFLNYQLFVVVHDIFIRIL